MVKQEGRLLASAAALLLGMSAVSATGKEFRIGAIGTFTGPFGVLGESMRKGAELAAEQRGNKVLGVPVVFQWEDDETKPQVAVQKAMSLMSNGASMLLAPVNSGSTAAVATASQRGKTPLLVTLSILDELTTSNNPYLFRTSNTSAMEVEMMARLAKERRYEKVFIIASDYKVARDTATSLKGRFAVDSITTVGELYPPLGAQDYSIMINKIAQSDAKAVFIGLVGSDLITFLKQADQVGLQRTKAFFGHIIMDESIGRAVGEGGIGVNSALRYHYTIDNPANQAFVAAYRKKYGEYPDQYAGEAYDGMSWMLDVIDRTGSWKAEDWIAAFKGSRRPNSIEGEKVMRPCDNQATQPGFYGEGVRGKGEQPPITMKITARYAAADLFKPCP